ncbi:MAG: MarR family transcriptional regulator [Blautia sp.]|nr:MarR family transcriptional regulator [Blautia sp.]
MKSGSDECPKAETLEDLARDFLDIQILYSKQVSQLAELLQASGEYGILYTLYREQRCFTAGDLAEAVGLTPGRITNVLKALEKKNRIVRKRDAHDKRKTIVSLTEEGTLYVCQIYHQAEMIHQQLVSRIGEEDAKNFIRITRRLFEISKEMSEDCKCNEAGE